MNCMGSGQERFQLGKRRDCDIGESRGGAALVDRSPGPSSEECGPHSYIAGRHDVIVHAVPDIEDGIRRNPHGIDDPQEEIC